MSIVIRGIKVDPQRQLFELDRAEMEDSLYIFLRNAWRQIDPSPWVDGWPIEAVAEHLQAVVDGDIKRLLINIPPRCAKSSLCSVALPAWIWAQEENTDTSGPNVPMLFASYAERLAMRDSVRCRRLIESPWYQNYWGERFKLSSDQNTKSRFSNDKGGERLITSVGATVTGEGGNLIVIDDPNAANEAFSDATVEATIDWWDGTMSTRLNNMNTGAYIVIQQRLAENDLSGHILEKNVGDWTHLMLPMEYEPERSFVTSIGWKDPRSIPGELLWKERFDAKAIKQLKAALGPTGAAGQLQQSPQPKGGGVIKRDWWQCWEGDGYPPMDFILASLDTAYTEKEENDPSAMTVWGVFTLSDTAVATRVVGIDGRPMTAGREYSEQTPKLMLMNAWRERLPFNELVHKVAQTCKQMKVDRLIIENKAAGISVSQELRRLYGNEAFQVLLQDPKSMDKLSRLYSVQHLFAEGMIYAPDRQWADMVITEVSLFPKSKHDDLTDTVSQSIRHLRDMGLLVRGPEKTEEVASRYTYPGNNVVPLYPA